MRRGLPYLLLFLLAGCAGTPGRAPSPVREGPEQEGAGAASSEQGGAENSAVIALLNSADRERAAGRRDNAAAMLEQALNLEPKNAALWCRLALLRLQQENWQQAAVLAHKSNSLIRNNNALKRRNWRVIAVAQRQMGNTAAAAAAEAEIEKLVNGK